MRVLTAGRSRAADRAATEAGVPVDLLMEQAGRGLAEVVDREARQVGAHGCVILAGNGANGGDGLACARMLADRGWPVRCLVPGGRAAYGARSPEAAAWAARVDAYGVTWGPLDATGAQDAFATWERAVAVDAILGTGVHGALRAEVRDALAVARRRAVRVVACDLPTGVDPDTGGVAEGAVPADVTVTMGAWKAGLVLWPGAGLAGRVEVAPIGLGPFLDAAGEAPWERLEDAEAAALLPARPPDVHKGSAGRVVIWAGSPGFGGAAVLATEGALRAGAGLVTTVSTPEVRAALLAGRPQAMTLSRLDPREEERAWRLTAAADAVACGPGLGTDAAACSVVETVFARAAALVLDADALNCIAQTAARDPEVWGRLAASRGAQGGRLVLTPHAGEATRLWQSLPAVRLEGSPEPPSRPEMALRLARESRAVVVLKGHPSLVAHPDGRLTFNTTGGPVLATGGAGDLLTGVTVALLGQGLDAYDAARLAVFLHGRAADMAARRAGRRASMDRGVSLSEVSARLPTAAAALREVAHRSGLE